jgi:hypothetical protein
MSLNAVLIMKKKKSIIIKKIRLKYIGVAQVAGVVIWPTPAMAVAEILIL